jgi:hypothetical protein
MGTAVIAPSSPHEHLVQSLQSVLSFQGSSTAIGDNGGGSGVGGSGRRWRSRLPMPPVPRSFLLSGPPGVGKTHSVRTAVDVANSWRPPPRGRGGREKDDERDQAVQILLIRGSEMLSASGGHAGAARGLRRTFEGAVSWAASSLLPAAAAAVAAAAMVAAAAAALGGGIIYDNLCVWVCHCCMNGAPVGDLPHLYATVELWDFPQFQS